MQPREGTVIRGNITGRGRKQWDPPGSLGKLEMDGAVIRYMTFAHNPGGSGELRVVGKRSIAALSLG